MQKWLICIAVAASAEAQVLSHQGFESLDGLQLAKSKADAKLSLSTLRVRTGKAALRIDYRAPGKASRLHVAWPARIVRMPSTISLWVFGDGSRNLHGVRLVDRSGETHYFSLGLLHAKEWRLCTIDLDAWGKRRQCWGGDGNKEIDLPITAIAYDVRSYSAYGACKPRGSVVIDDLVVRAKEQAQAPTSLGLHSATPMSQSVGRFECFELRCVANTGAGNPYDPDQVQLRAKFVAPSGKATTVDGFFIKPYRAVLGRREELVEHGAPHWRVRFAPTEVGEYQYAVTLSDGKTAYPPQTGRFACVPSRRRGFLRVSADDPNYAEFSTGDAFIGIGVAGQMWGGDRANCLQRYKSILSDLAAFGGNYTSVNMETLDAGVFGLDWRRPLGGSYDQENAARLDYVLHMAERRGIALVANVFATALFDAKHWAKSRFHKAQGGPCKTAAEFFTHPEARRMQKRLLRYIVARWGYSRSIGVWELCNEVNYSEASRTDPAIVRAWHADMAAYLHAIDPNRHLVSTSFGSSDLCEDPALWRLPQIDSTIIHIYTNEPVQGLWRRVATKRRYGKPCLGGECGIPFPIVNKAYERDPTGLHFHNAAWASILSGAAGNVLPWWGDRYWNTLDLAHLLRPLAQFCQGVDWPRERFERVRLEAQPWDAATTNLEDVAYETSLAFEKPSLTEFHFEGRELYSLREKQHIDDDPKVLLSRLPAGVIFGSDDAARHARLTFVFDAPGKTTARLVLGSVAKAGAVLRITGPGRAQSVDVRDQDGRSDPSAHELNQSISLALPQGRSEWAIENVGKGWVALVRVEIERYARPAELAQLMVIGLKGRRTALVWFYDRHSSWYQRSIGKPVRAFERVCAYLPADKAARYRVQWWDTWRGGIISQSDLAPRNGRLRLAPPRFERDMACKVRRLD